MMHHGAPSGKRSITFSNHPLIRGLDLGVLSKKEREAKTKVKTTRASHAPMCTHGQSSASMCLHLRTLQG